MKKLSLLLLSMSMVSLVYAGGFKIGLQGQKQIGMGHVGIGLAQDASSVYFNPGALSFIENQINFGVSAIVPRVQFLETNTNISTFAENQTFTPFSLYANYHIKNSPVTLGVGVYTPFGSGVKYPTDWTGRYVLTNINLTNVFIQPTVAYKVNDFLSFGAGFVYSLGHVTLEKELPIENSIGEGSAKLEGSAAGFGYNLGAYFNVNKRLTGGVVYHSRVDMKVDNGSATFSNIPTALSSTFPNTTFTTELPLPSEAGVGFAYKANKDFTVGVDVNYTFWNSFESLGFDYADNTSALVDDPSPRNYENAWAFRAGFQYDASRRVSVRAGAFFDQTPVQNGYVNPELPDNDKVGISMGGTYWLEDRISIDFSLLYEDVIKRRDINTETQLSGTYKTKVIIPGVGISYLINKKVKKRINTL